MKTHRIKLTKKSDLVFKIKDLFQNSYGMTIEIDASDYWMEECEYTLLMRTPSNKSKRFKLYKENEEIIKIVDDEDILDIEDNEIEIIIEEPVASTTLIWPITLDVTKECGWHEIQIEIKSDESCEYTKVYPLFINESLSEQED